MMTEKEVLGIFKDCGAYLKGHFQLTSGRHSDTYLEKFQVLQYPRYTERLCRELAGHFRCDGIDVVVGPVTGGIVLSYEVAKNLNVRGVFAERENGRMALRRGFDVAGERVLIVEDVVTTGGSVREVMEAVLTKGGTVVGVGMLVNRSGGTVDFGVKTTQLLSLNIATYDPEDCPMCKCGQPLTKRGSRGISTESGWKKMF